MKTNNKISIDESGRTLPFTVPENYFEDFALQMDRNIGLKMPTKRIIHKWMYAVAAVMIGVALLSPLMYQHLNQSVPATQENYVSYVLSQVDEGVMIDYYVDQNNNK